MTKFSSKEIVEKAIKEFISKRSFKPTHLMVSASFMAVLNSDIAEEEGWSAEDAVLNEVTNFMGLKVGVSVDMNFPDFVILG